MGDFVDDCDVDVCDVVVWAWKVVAWVVANQSQVEMPQLGARFRWSFYE